MRILYLYQYFGTPKGSWSTRVYEMTRRWVKAGHHVTVITTPYDKSDLLATKFIDKQLIEGVQVIVVNLAQSNKHSLISRIFRAIFFSLLSTYFTLTLRYDVSIASSGPITIGLPALVARWIRKKPLVFEVRDLWPKGAEELEVIKNRILLKWAYWFERLIYRNSELVVACSQGMQQDIKRRYPLTSIIVVPNSCDIELFKNKTDYERPDFTKEMKIVLYAGSLGLMDNCIQLVQAAHSLHLQDRDIIFVVLGDGAEKEMLIAKAKELSLTNIFFLGLVPKGEVVGWMQWATLSLVVFKNTPMLDTSSPNKFFDSIAAGLPVVQTTQGWIKELLQEHGGGLTVEPNNENALAEAILQICNNAILRDQLSQEAAALAKDFFDRDELSRYMLKEIQHAIKPDNRR